MERDTECFIFLFISRMGAEERDHFCLLSSPLSSFLSLFFSFLPSLSLSFFPPFFLCFQYHWVSFFSWNCLILVGTLQSFFSEASGLTGSRWAFFALSSFPVQARGLIHLVTFVAARASSHCGRHDSFCCVTAVGKGRVAGGWDRCLVMTDPSSATDQQNYTP